MDSKLLVLHVVTMMVVVVAVTRVEGDKPHLYSHTAETRVEQEFGSIQALQIHRPKATPSH